MLFILPLLAQILVTAPVAPPPSPLPPPIMMVPAPVRAYRPIPGERFVVDVEVRAGNELLWSGPLRVASNAQSTFLQSQSEPREATCPDEGYGSVQSSLNVQLMPARVDQAGVPAITVTVRWSRPIAGSCAPRAATRTVELSDAVALLPGKVATVKGDAGLIVELRRR